MHVTLREIKSALYFSFWVIFMIAFPLLLFVTFKQPGPEPITYLICSCTVGILSGLSPPRSFLACFLALLIIAISSVSNEPFYVWYMLLFSALGIFCGLIGLASAVIRRLVLRSGSEQLRLITWQWAFLIGGVSILADCFLIPFHYNAVIQMHYFSSFFKSLAAFAVGLFAVGLYAGAYYGHEHKTLIKDMMKFSMSGHSVFLVSFTFLLLMKLVFRGDILFLPVMGLLFLFSLVGTQLGYQLGKDSHETQVEI
jgi:hypothetical protein